MPLADQGMKYGLRALNAFAGLQLLDRIGARERAEWLINRAARDGTRTAARANRTFTNATRRGKPARMSKARSRDLFDLTPDDEQQMLRESFQGFAADKLRKAAEQADVDCAAPPELLAQANELGLSMLGVPEELGGVFEELSSTTSVLVSETLAHGDMGIAVAALAPAAVATAISLYGNAEQQSDYLPAFVGEDVPAAAFAVLEPRALFDPFELETTARVTGGGFVLDGIKSLVPRAADSELFVVAANLEDSGPALFIVESGTDGVFLEAEPAMGIRASATGRLALDGVTLPSTALLGEGSPEIYRDAVRRSRLAWCAVAVGTGQAVLDYVIPYVNERVAFGEPIANRQAVAFTVADMGLELEGIRLTTLRAASRADQGKDFAEQVAVARQLVADKGMEIGSNGLQMLGGHGFVKEHPVERWYRDLRAAGLMEGALLV